VQQLRDGMGAGQAAGRLQLVIHSQSNAWPNRADISTGKGQDRAMSILLIATEQSASEQRFDANSVQHTKQGRIRTSWQST